VRSRYKSQLSQDAAAAASTKMQSVSAMLISDLSSEARTFRWLVCGFAAAKLRENGLALPTGLLVDDQQVTVDDEELVSRQDLQEAFARCVDKFMKDNEERLQTLVDDLPPSKRTISECIMEVNRNVLLFDDDDVSWGRMVVVTAFLTKVAVRCIKNELSEAVLPLIDQAALQVDEKLAHFIRFHGGWSAFARAFKRPKKEGSWVKEILATVSLFLAMHGKLSDVVYV
jgi:Apoptosis regulator proteins, Bcl-2 family